MITYVENVIKEDEYNYLNQKVGWVRREDKVVKKALDKTLYSITAYDYDDVIGYGRIIGDETIFLYIQDIMVIPEYQGRQIGSTIMHKLLRKIEEYRKENPKLTVYLAPDKGRENFYKKFGFKTRSELDLGEGMVLMKEKTETRIFNWTNGINESELQEVKKVIANDGVIIFPTDTVYGIGCNCLSETAIEKIYDLKNRPEYKPINVLTNSIENISKVAKSLNAKEKELITNYMPGALTLILDKKDYLPKHLTAGLDTVGVRIPKDDIALKILSTVDYPLATTSANISGEKEGIEISDFLEAFAGKVDIIIDGGPTKIQIPSTIIRVEDEKKLNIIREGAIKVK